MHFNDFSKDFLIVSPLGLVSFISYYSITSYIINSPKMSKNNLDPSNVTDFVPGKTDTSHVEFPVNSRLDEKQRGKLKWKLDWFILPLISGVYFFGSMVIEVTIHQYILSKLMPCD